MRIYLLLFIVAAPLFSVSCATPGGIVSLRQKVEDNPGSSSAHYELAQAYLKQGIEWEMLRGVGVPIIVNKGWTNKAKTEFQKVVELDPGNSEPHYWLEVIYNAQGKYELADLEAELYTDLVAKEHRRSKK
ncbi:MAG: hypothetical protein NOU37_03225 [Candidatus Brocadiales bacterium]|nr:hypothetical protein [Candidatus Bathyanammoxibius sp.]MCQ4574247.1 hypothetical protein [Candidatus Bathyanammoxibius amoris]